MPNPRRTGRPAALTTLGVSLALLGAALTPVATMAQDGADDFIIIVVGEKMGDLKGPDGYATDIERPGIDAKRMKADPGQLDKKGQKIWKGVKAGREGVIEGADSKVYGKQDYLDITLALDGPWTLFWYDQPRADAPLHVGSWLEWTPPGGPIQVSAEYEEGAVPESCLADEELRQKLLEAAERLHQDPEIDVWSLRANL